MPELLTSIMEIGFATGAIGAAACTGCMRHNRGVILCFLVAGLLLCALLCLVSKPVIAIIIAITYASIASLFETLPEEEVRSDRRMIPVASVAVLGIVAVSIYNWDLTVTSRTDAVFSLTELSGIILTLLMVFVFVIFGMLSLFNPRR